MQPSPMTQQGLYRPGEFKDNCGFGLIAHREGEPSHHLLQTALQSLTCMTHRGGIASDGRTGDGCGLLVQLPKSFFQSIAKTQFSTVLDDTFAVGLLFLPADLEARTRAQQIFKSHCDQAQLNLIGWRDVPTDPSYCGEIALAQMPYISQVIITGDHGISEAALNRKLFMLRRRVHLAMQPDPDFYISSLSCTVLSYKGLVMPEDFANFYKDLKNPDFKTAICVFHQRFSTNTLPRWQLAQPFRYLAHNGEINTIMGNRNWSVARTGQFDTPFLPELDLVQPLVNRSGSDSSSLDNMLEVLLLGGMDMFRAARMLLPPAWQNLDTMDPSLKAFYEYNSMHMEPWDGPAGIVLTDGRYAVCLQDRNGLRPSRWVITKEGYITIASEIGTWNYKPEDVVAKGRVGPGQILAIDTQTGELLHTPDIDNRLKKGQPYQKWLKQGAKRIKSTFNTETVHNACVSDQQLKTLQKLFQVTLEERVQILKPMAQNGQEGVGSMGDDTPMAVLSSHIRPLTDYFRQQFAQVTNPPIDPLREAIVMSLETCIGPERNVFEETPKHAERVILRSPILSPSKFRLLMDLGDKGFPTKVLDLNYDSGLSLEVAIQQLCDAAEAAVTGGHVILVLSDRSIDKTKLPIHALFATGAVHHHLVEKGLRCEANIVLETAVARDSHHFATLIGFGATAVYPYLAFSVVHDLVTVGEVTCDLQTALRQYRQAVVKGLLKILSKMGISTVASYRGAQLFEAVGLSEAVVNLCFKGVTSRIRGARFIDFERESQTLSKAAFTLRKPISAGGVLKYIHGGEYHAYNPDVVATLHKAVRSGSFDDYQDYVDAVSGRGTANFRDLLEINYDRVSSIPLAEVEPLEKLFSRFDSAGMSLGALSPEAHESIAIAMNRLGGRSNSGEGGEDAVRFGTEKVSKIKQIASGRFGVTPHYLMNAEVLQIKIAQGAKPGEGGQLPGGKVNALIARLRFSVPGVTLISPPPHHDIYSIEDLAQLIYDLKQINPEALVSVKLVSEPGVGTIAAGVAKAYADLITISGYDGGTAASPLTSIRHAGSPWELGLSEAQQALRANGLRHKVRLQADGGLKHGLDVIKAAILGAESFGFGTAPMVALGCKYLRICHLNNCATGVATQQGDLRKDHYIGEAEMVMNFFRFVAEDTRRWLAKLGFTRLEDIVGRTDLLDVLPGSTEKQNHLNLDPLLLNDAIESETPNVCSVSRNDPHYASTLADQMLLDMMPAIEAKQGGIFDYPITSCDRSIGARISGQIASKYGNAGMEGQPLKVEFSGSAGQSFGVWNAGGLHLSLDGDANDYVGKGMAGGKIIIRPPAGSVFEARFTSIIGNTCLYGATGGKLYAAGMAGERFAVRNSGAVAVVEGVGDHCCEYMTGGEVIVLGRTGYNFGAGMTGGQAFVLDLDNYFVDRYNRELIDVNRISAAEKEEYVTHLEGLIADFAKETGSAWAKTVIDNFENYVGRFWLVTPKAAQVQKLVNHIRVNPE